MPRLRRILTAGITALLMLPAAAAAAGAPAAAAQATAQAGAKAGTKAAATKAGTPTGPIFSDGFESPVVRGQSQRLATGAHIGPWTVTAGNVDLATARLWQTPTGHQSLDLDGAANGTISTTIAVRPLTSYKVTYSLAGNPAGNPMVKTGEVRVNGKTVQRFTFDTSLTSLSRMAFGSRSLYVFSLSDRLRLDFVSTTSPAGYGPVLDDVRVDNCLLMICPATRRATRV